MNFIKTQDNISISPYDNIEFYDAEIMTVYFETKPEILEKLIPPPLKPAPMPFGAAFIARYPKTNIGITYQESALFLLVDFNGEPGIYPLSVPVTDDMALILGREIFGYPKKMATVGFEREGNDVKGWSERHGIRFFEVTAKLTGKFNDTGAQKLMTERMKSNPDVSVFNFKYFPAPDGEGFDYKPRLVRGVVKRDPKSIEMGEAELKFSPSEHDPWSDVEIVRVIGAVYTFTNNTLLPGSVVAEVKSSEFLPYSFMKLDSFRA